MRFKHACLTASVLHTQSVSRELPVDASVCGGHVKHVDSTVAPTASEYLPSLQSLQAKEPDPILYFPALHVVQFPPLGPVEPGLQVQT